MRKVTMLNRISLDGMFASRNQGTFGMDWFVQDPEVEKHVHALGEPGDPAPDTLLLGGATFKGFEASWLPFLTDPAAPPPLRAVAEELTKMTKIVFSGRLADTPWANTRIEKEPPGKVVRKLKSEPGGGIMVMGSGTVVRNLASEGLIDEYVFIVSPVVAGSGKPLFPDIPQQNLSLVSAKAFPSGNVVLHHRRLYQPE